jgi:phage regulator Rha-like protein
MSDVTLSKIENMIHVIKGQKVMLDSDLAELYGVETKNLNKAVRRNISRFQLDFMFQLDSSDLEVLRFQIGTANSARKKRFLPYVFTENGAAMLSGVLSTERAISVNISIMRTFTKMRSILLHDEVLSKRMQELEKGTIKVFRRVFERLDSVDEEIQALKREKPLIPAKRNKIGLK